MALIAAQEQYFITEQVIFIMIVPPSNHPIDLLLLSDKYIPRHVWFLSDVITLKTEFERKVSCLLLF